jgi:hypothetical protein
MNGMRIYHLRSAEYHENWCVVWAAIVGEQLDRPDWIGMGRSHGCKRTPALHTRPRPGPGPGPWTLDCGVFREIGTREELLFWEEGGRGG